MNELIGESNKDSDDPRSRDYAPESPSLAEFRSMCAKHEWWYERTDCGYDEYERQKRNEDHLRAIAKTDTRYQVIFDEEQHRWWTRLMKGKKDDKSV